MDGIEEVSFGEAAIARFRHEGIDGGNFRGIDARVEADDNLTEGAFDAAAGIDKIRIGLEARKEMGGCMANKESGDR